MTLTQLGPYRIERRLAIGGMAEVFVARREGPHGFHKRVALKRILPHLARDAEFVSMFIDEAKLAAQLEHPNVVQVFDFGEIDGELFLAMEYVEGASVARLLRAADFYDEAVPLDIALYIAEQSARGLAHLHTLQDDAGKPLAVVHRDVSPANLLLTRAGHIKVTDFGIAAIAGRDAHTEAGHVRGKLGYMSPEQVMALPLDDRSDVFALAAILAEMLIGRTLFGTGSDLDVLVRIRDVDLAHLQACKRPIPADVRALLEQALTQDARTRPDAAAFADSCDRAARGRGHGPGAARLADFLCRLEVVQGEEGAPAAGAKTVEASGEDAATTRPVPPQLQASAAASLTSPALYRFVHGEGQVRGPVSLPRLIQAITAGQVRSDTLVSREGGNFVAAQTLAELQRFLRSPALQWADAALLERADHSGRVRPGRLLAVVHRLTVARRSGVLHLEDGERRKKIYFVDGRPEFVASTDRSELLGEYLVAQGLCLRMEVEMALALLPRYGGRLGDALVGLGILRPLALFRAICAQVRERFLEAFRWQQGRWAFVDGERSHEEAFPIGHDCFELLRDVAAESELADLKSLMAPLIDCPLQRLHDPPVPWRAYRVPASWDAVYAALDGRLDVPTLGRRLAQADPSIDTTTLYRACHLALSCDLARPIDLGLHRASSLPPA